MTTSTARITLTLAAFAAVAVPVSSAHAAPTTGVELLPPTRVVDTRQAGSELASGVERALPAATGDIINVTLVGGTTVHSKAYLHTCGSAPSSDATAANVVVEGEQWTNMVPVRAGDTCLTRIGDADVVIDLVARRDQPDGLAYVAHPQPVELAAALPAGGTIAAAGGLPGAAAAVAVIVTLTAPTAGVSVLSGQACDGSPSGSQVLSAQAGATTSNLMLLALDAGGNICFSTAGTAPEAVAIDRWGYLADGVAPTSEGLPFAGFVDEMLPGFTPQTPVRAFDTRDATAVAGGTVYRHQFTGLPVDATAVALNLTVTGTTAPGFVSAYPCEGQRPDVSNVNYTAAGVTVPNFSIVALGPSHELCFFALSTTHLIADVSGFFADGSGDGYIPQDPVRVFDTREAGTAIEAGTTYVADLSPYGTRSAAVLNVTVTQPDRPGFVTAYPCDAGTPPTASNLNFGAGQTRPNLVTVRVPADGKICFYSSARVHLLADLAGGYSSSSEIGFLQAEPWRVFDTRGEPDPGPLEGGQEYEYDLGSLLPRALAWNVTATEPTSPGFVSIHPCTDSVPNASNVNYDAAGTTVANFAIVRPNAEGLLCLFSLATAHLIADEAGIFVDPLPAYVYYED